jgi:hypothetical protein
MKLLLSPVEAEPLSNGAVSNGRAEAVNEQTTIPEHVVVALPVTAAEPTVKKEKVASSSKPWAKPTVAEAQGEPDML